MTELRIMKVEILNDGTGLSDIDKAEMERKHSNIRHIDFSIEEVMPTEVITSNPELVLKVAAAIKNAATHASPINENPPEHRRLPIRESPHI